MENFCAAKVTLMAFQPSEAQDDARRLLFP